MLRTLQIMLVNTRYAEQIAGYKRDPFKRAKHKM